jgi:hypothetical protein
MIRTLRREVQTSIIHVATDEGVVCKEIKTVTSPFIGDDTTVTCPECQELMVESS